MWQEVDFHDEVMNKVEECQRSLRARAVEGMFHRASEGSQSKAGAESQATSLRAGPEEIEQLPVISTVRQRHRPMPRGIRSIGRPLRSSGDIGWPHQPTWESLSESRSSRNLSAQCLPSLKSQAIFIREMVLAVSLLCPPKSHECGG